MSIDSVKTGERFSPFEEDHQSASTRYGEADHEESSQVRGSDR